MTRLAQALRQQFRSPPLKSDYFAMTGGLNLTGPSISKRPGELLGVLNYETWRLGGYRRCDGIERFDGRPSPSEGSYYYLNFDAGVTHVLVGDTITGVTSGATGIAALDATVSSGAYVSSDAVGFLVLTSVSGTFVDDENLQVSAATVSVMNGVAVKNGAATDALDAIYLVAAIMYLRGQINSPAGSGAIRGVWGFSGEGYCVRDNADATAGVLFKESTAGWVSQDLGRYLEFDDGVSEIFDGVEITGKTSGATSTVGRVALQKGSWSGTAEGGISMSAVSGTFQVAEVIQQEILEFDVGTSKISKGDALTGDTTGATATVGHVILQSGDWKDGDADGDLYLVSVTGTFQVNEKIQVSAANMADVKVINTMTDSADATSADVANALPAGGKYEFENANFKGSTDSAAMYGVNGVGKAFEWDGTYFTPIKTGMTTDTPNHIEAMTGDASRLYLSFPKGSVQKSSVGIPFEWTVVTGALQIGTADEIVGMLVLPGNVLLILNRNRSYLYYAASGQLRNHSEESGGIEWTLQRMSYPLYLDDRGIMNIQQVQAYGDFVDASMSDAIAPLIDDYKDKVNCSLRVRSKSQYRIFFNDGTILVMSFSKAKLIGYTTFDYGSDFVMNCAASFEDANGKEVLLVGADNGMVYEVDKGNSFDGDEIEHLLRPAYYHYKSPLQRKQFKFIQIEGDFPSDVTLYVTPDFWYGNPNIPPGLTRTIPVVGKGGFWNVSNWNEFNWSSQVSGTMEASIDGLAINMAAVIYGKSDVAAPHIIQGMGTMFYPRRGLR